LHRHWSAVLVLFLLEATVGLQFVMNTSNYSVKFVCYLSQTFRDVVKPCKETEVVNSHDTCNIL